MKILALDLGDKWVGSAISDPLGITCRPYETVELKDVETFLEKVLHDEPVTKVIVGYPKTVSAGQESDQTKKIVAQKEKLEENFSSANDRTIEWILWDERLTSKRAEKLKGRAKSKEEKVRSHSVAASFILQNYLDHLAFKKSL